MSWSYGGDPANSPIDAVRFMIGDTDENEQILTDEEIQFLIDTYGDNPLLLEYHAFAHMATVFARAIKRSLGPQSEDPTARLAYFQSKAKELKAKLAAGGLAESHNAYPKIFRKGMQSNPPWPRPCGRGGNYLV